MECRIFERELTVHHNEQELGVEARLHADSCTHCRLLFQNHQMLFNAIAEERQVRVPPFLSTRVMADLQKREVRFTSRPVWHQALQVAAVLVALVSGFIGSVLMEQRSVTDDFSVVLSDYFLMGDAGLTIEEGWLYSDTYEN